MTQNSYYYNEHDENQVKKILKTKKKKKLKKRLKFFLYMILIVLIGAFFLSDYSKVKSIHIEGNKDIASNEILNSISIDKDTYFFLVNKDKIAEEVKAIGMIKKAVVHVDLVGNVTIDVEEAEKVAYCEMGSSTYVIDELGGVSLTEDQEVIKELHSTPCIMQFEDIELLKTFAKEYVNIPGFIKTQTSDILYEPKSNDTTRLKFIMDNGKILYLRIEDMVDQLNRIDYEAFMTGYSDRCVFSFEGEYVYTEKCE